MDDVFIKLIKWIYARCGRKCEYNADSTAGDGCGACDRRIDPSSANRKTRTIGRNESSGLLIYYLGPYASHLLCVYTGEGLAVLFVGLCRDLCTSFEDVILVCNGVNVGDILV